MGAVAGAGDDCEFGSRNTLGVSLAVGARDHVVVLAPEDQGRCRNSMQAVFQRVVVDVGWFEADARA